MKALTLSKTITGGDLWNYLISGDERLRRAAHFLGWIIDGKIRISPPTVLGGPGGNYFSFSPTYSKMIKFNLVKWPLKQSCQQARE
jgi:hypothetical protein